MRALQHVHEVPRPARARPTRIDAQWIATGHYARVVDGELHRGVDHAKDQSYFLWGIDRAVLRAHAAAGRRADEGGDARASRTRSGSRWSPRRSESQDICFVPDGDHTEDHSRSASAPTRRRSRAGRFVLRDGTSVGEHDGFARFTIGQRRGLPGGFREPMFVVAIRPDDRAVVIGPREELLGRGVVAREVNWLVDAPRGRRAGRGAGAPSRARRRAAEIVRVDGDEIELALDEPVCAITPGQSLVLYDGERVLGGGVIEAGRAAGAERATRARLPIFAA